MNSKRVVETDNYGGDYPDESFFGFPCSPEGAKALAELANKLWGGDSEPRYWKVVDADYKLLPGFEP